MKKNNDFDRVDCSNRNIDFCSSNGPSSSITRCRLRKKPRQSKLSGTQDSHLPPASWKPR